MVRLVSRPATRLLAMLELLQDRPGVGGRELAERLEVDPRTVRRYAVKLQELGIPVEAERGRLGGYRLRPGFRLPPLMLRDDEATAVVLGLVAAQRLGLATAAPAVDGALAKVARVLPAALRERTRALQETLGFTRPAPDAPAPGTDAVLTLAEATRRRRRVRVRYAPWRGEEGERDLDPYGLVVHGGRWYLAAHEHLRGEVRTFRVDRVRSVELRPEATAPPEGFDAVAHVARSLARVPWTWEVEVVLEAPMEEVQRRLSPTMAELEPAAGGVLARMRAERLDGAAAMLAGLGWPFRVLRPAELRAEVRALAERLAACAEREA
jgi:predicted DNA-binding transcriptional regulator YafY